MSGGGASLFYGSNEAFIVLEHPVNSFLHYLRDVPAGTRHNFLKASFLSCRQRYFHAPRVRGQGPVASTVLGFAVTGGHSFDGSTKEPF